MRKLISLIKVNYPRIYPGTYLIDVIEDTADIAVITNDKILMLEKYIYKSNKGKYIRVNVGTNNYKRVYIEEDSL